MKHTGPKNPKLKHKVFPSGRAAVVNWGNDWVVWCQKNCDGQFSHDCIWKPTFKTFFLFENKDDACQFKLTWG